MQYNKRNFGEATDALTLNPYNDDVGAARLVPPFENLFLITEDGIYLTSEDSKFYIAEQPGL